MAAISEPQERKTAEKEPKEIKTWIGARMRPDLPIYEGVLSKIGASWMTWQDSHCADWELDYIRCASRVGHKQAERKCAKYFEDLNECIGRSKTAQRYYAIQKERKNKGLYQDPVIPDAVQFNRDRTL